MNKIFFVLVFFCLISFLFSDTRYFYAVGSNSNGQLGIHDFRNISSVASSVSLFTTSINFGVYQSNSKIYGWGEYTNNNLPTIGNYTYSIYCPIQLPSSTTYTSIVSGTSHTLFLDASSQVYGMGVNTAYQISGTTQNTFPSITQISSLSSYNFKKIFAFGTSSYGIDSSLNLYGWGNNNEYEVKNVPQTYVQVPFLMKANVNDIAGGDTHLLIRDTSNVTWACGSNLNYQLGLNDSTVDYQRNIVAIPFLQSLNVYAIGAGSSSSLVYTSIGQLWGFGNNANGQLGTDYQVGGNVSNPTLINTTVLNGETVIQIKISSTHSLLLTSSNHVYGAGSNTYNQIGISSSFSASSTLTKFSRCDLTEATISSATSAPIIQIGIMSGVSLFYTSDGILFAIGNNIHSGIGYYYATLNKVLISDGLIDQVSAGYQFSVARTINGNLYSWGHNDLNQITPDNTLDHPVPYSVPYFNDKNVTNITSSGGSQQLGWKIIWDIFTLTNVTNQVIGWGRNDDGQLAMNSLTPQFVTSPGPLAVDNTTVYTKIESGQTHVLVMGYPKSSTTKQFNLYGWGCNTNGQLGLLIADYRLTPIQLATGIIDMCAGDFHTVYITKSNAVYVVGNNQQGQLGLADIQLISDFNINPFLTNQSALRVWCGSQTTFVLTKNGMYVMGDNTYGALGLNQSGYYNTPQLVPFFNDAYKVSSAKKGGSHTIILKQDGTVIGMGLNTCGQLGTGNYTNVFGYVWINNPVPGKLFLDVNAGLDHTLLLIGSKDCPNNCNDDRGECNYVQGTCACYDEFDGVDCSLYRCNPGSVIQCSNHGTCDQINGVCLCEAAYNGAECQYLRCPNNCYGNGNCDRTKGECNCDPGWTGADCSTPSDAMKKMIGIMVIVVVFFAWIF